MAIFKEMIPKLVREISDGIPVIVSNPVDILTYVALKISEFPARRVIGLGSILDTARFGFEIGGKFGVDPRNVHAYLIGEHGYSRCSSF